MKSMFKTAFAAMAAVSCVFGASAGDPYKVRVQFTDDQEGVMVYMVNFDTKEKIDSTVVSQKVALFKGEIDEPVLARIMHDGQPAGTFVLESGSIVVDPTKRKVFGSMLNDPLQDFNDKAADLSERYSKTEDDSLRSRIYDEFMTLAESVMTDNIDNPIGYYLFVDKASSMDATEFASWLARYPDLARYQRVSRISEALAKKSATSPGKMFTDFEVTYNGKTSRLSDYVGKGKYVLADYWASWCGPCLRQIPVIKELLAEFGDKGLEVLGVAVWDEPENTAKAIESHGITWPCIINAQTIPTDIYGINGIPCIILYGPDGTILSRDKQGDDLKADVRAAFAGTLKVD